MEPPTGATDVYALGCVAFALVTGKPPFSGSMDELQQAHLNAAPPSLTASPPLRQLVASCMRKPPGARPSLQSVIEQLERVGSTAHRQDPIVVAGAAVAERAALGDANVAKERSVAETRAELARAGHSALSEIRARLFDEIASATPMARRVRDNAIVLGDGTLKIEPTFSSIPAGRFRHSGWDVISGWVVRVTQAHNKHYRERAANLWYADPSRSGSFRWFEVGYFRMWERTVTRDEPYAIVHSEELEDADLAMANIVHTVSPSPRPPHPIDGVDEAWFVGRWKQWLAQAASSALTRPSHLPEGS